MVSVIIFSPLQMMNVKHIFQAVRLAALNSAIVTAAEPGCRSEESLFRLEYSWENE